MKSLLYIVGTLSDENKTSSMHVGSNSTLLELSEKNFDEIVDGNKYVLVDFWATWCGPCQFMLPIFDKLAKKYGNTITFGRLNVDDNQGVLEYERALFERSGYMQFLHLLFS